MKQSDRSYYVYAYLRSSDSSFGAKYTPYYIGKGKNRRAFSSKRAIKAPRSKEFIVFIQEGLTEEEAFRLEKYCIALYGRIDKGCGVLRNRCDGGEGPSGAVLSEERRLALIKLHTGRKCSKETRQKMSQSQKGREISMEARLKISRAAKGRRLSEDHRRKIALAGMGRVTSDETKEKLSLSRAKHIYKLISPDGGIYTPERLAVFCDEHGLDPRAIRAVARGDRNVHRGWKAQILEQLK